MFNCSNIAEDLNNEDPHYYLYILSFAVLVTSLVYFPACFLYFYKNRMRDEKLRRRNILLLGCYCLGLMVSAISFCLRNVVGAAHYPCDVRYFIFAFFTLCICPIASTFRLFGLYFRIKFNRKLLANVFNFLEDGELLFKPGIETFKPVEMGTKERGVPSMAEVASTNNNPSVLAQDLQDIASSSTNQTMKNVLFFLLCWREHPHLPDSVQLAHLLASSRFLNSLFIITVILLMSISLAVYFYYIPPGIHCTGCSITQIMTGNSLLLGSFVIATILSMYYTWEYEDALGIKRELFVLGVWFLLMDICFLIPAAFIFEDLDKKGQWDWAVASSVQFYCMTWYSFVYEVNMILRSNTNVKQQADLKLDDILGSEEGTQAFALYLSVYLSSENLYFYQAVKKWKRAYSSRSSKITVAHAQDIVHTYISKEAALQVNVSHEIRNEIVNNILNAGISDITVFDRALQQAMDIMAGSILAGFLRSKYYKLYQNSLIIDKEL